MTHPRCFLSILAGALLVLALGCKRKPEQGSAPQPVTKPQPPQSRPARLAPDASAARPLVLRRLTVKSGFERAEVLERKDEQEAHWGKVAVKSWAVRGKDQVWTRVIEIQLGDRSPRSLSGYLPRWLKSHGCTAKEVVDLPPLEQGAGPLPPQLTFSGSCKGGERYLKRVLLLGDTAYELHVDASLRVKAARLREALLALFARLELGA